MTGRDLITAALKKIGAIAPGESLAADEATDGLAELNRMLGSWSNDGLTIHAITAETPLTLTSGDGSYTLGTSGDITTRPQKIEKAIIRSGNNDYPVRILSLADYAAISDKTSQADIPTSLYDDGGYPQRTIKLYPVPSAANYLVLYTKRALTEISTLDTSVSLPPGYEDALVYNLAIRLAPEYGRQTPAEVVKVADDSLGAIKRANHRPAYLGVDSALLGNGLYDINRGPA